MFCRVEFSSSRRPISSSIETFFHTRSTRTGFGVGYPADQRSRDEFAFSKSIEFQAFRTVPCFHLVVLFVLRFSIGISPPFCPNDFIPLPFLLLSSFNFALAAFRSSSSVHSAFFSFHSFALPALYSALSNDRFRHRARFRSYSYEFHAQRVLRIFSRSPFQLISPGIISRNDAIIGLTSRSDR